MCDLKYFFISLFIVFLCVNSILPLSICDTKFFKFKLMLPLIAIAYILSVLPFAICTLKLLCGASVESIAARGPVGSACSG